MINISYFFKRLQDVKLNDILAIFPMTVALVLCPYYKSKYSEVWLVGDTPNDARDNGYHFFEFLRKKYPQKKCMFVINTKSTDYEKIKLIGNVLNYGSLQHWVAYFLCQYNIFSKNIKPNRALCSFMEMCGFFHSHNVILQHGVTINDQRGMYFDRMKCDFLITATTEEQKFIQDRFGHPRGVVKLMGFPRFDSLHNVKANGNRILIIPTWRKWFNLPSHYLEGEEHFSRSNYFIKWASLITNVQLDRMISNYHLDVVFCLHPNLLKYEKEFLKIRSRVKIISWVDCNIQFMLKTSSLLITDYSSIFFDMVYMKKPIIFYQFDRKAFFQYHVSGEGWFDYESNPFGLTFETEKEAVNQIEKVVKNNYKVNDEYIKAHKRLFVFHDKNNSQRIYNQLVSKIGEKQL